MRSFCYVDDLISGFLRLTEAPTRVNGPVNLGNPGEFTILDPARKVIELTGSRLRIVHGPLPEDDPKQRRPDIEYARKVLGWSPTIDLDEGLRRTIPYFESLLAEGLIKTKAPSRSQILRVGGR
jgi:UDP-glucuronate decarboxylase